MTNSYSQDVELEFFEEACIPWAVEKVFTDCRVFMFVNTLVKVLRLDVLSGKFLVYEMLFIEEHNLGLNPQTDLTCTKLFV